jgi:hypothetical protein
MNIRLNIRSTLLAVTFALTLITIVSCTETGTSAQSTSTSLQSSTPVATTAPATELPVPTEPVSTTPSNRRDSKPAGRPSSTPQLIPTIAPTAASLAVAPATTSTPITVPTVAIEVLSTEPTPTIRVGSPTLETTVAPVPTPTSGPPPYHYTTQAEAEAGSVEMGCSGWDRVAVDTNIYYRACASTDLFAVLLASPGTDVYTDATPNPTITSQSSPSTGAVTGTIIPRTTPTPFPTVAPPPEFFYLTEDEALAKAEELGCVGTSGGLPPYYRVCRSEIDFQVFALNHPTTLSGDLCNIESDPTARFTMAPTDLSQIAYIVPAGSSAGGVIKPHSYLHNKFEADGKTNIRVPVYAVADAVLSSVDYYDSFLGIAEYLLFFDVTCEISFKYDHINEVVPKIAELVPEVSVDSGGGLRPSGITFEAGELIGYAYGAGNIGLWDFGAYDTTVTIQHANQARDAAGRGDHTVCPYDYFGDPLKSQMYSLFGAWSDNLIADAECTTTDRDVLGAASGAWFESPEFGKGASFAIATAPDSQINLSGIGGELKIPANNPTWLDPELMTTSHCYADGTRWIYLEVQAEGMQLATASGTGTCPNAIPTTDTTTYYR